MSADVQPSDCFGAPHSTPYETAADCGRFRIDRPSVPCKILQFACTILHASRLSSSVLSSRPSGAWGHCSSEGATEKQLLVAALTRRFGLAPGRSTLLASSPCQGQVWSSRSDQSNSPYSGLVAQCPKHTQSGVAKFSIKASCMDRPDDLHDLSIGPGMRSYASPIDRVVPATVELVSQ